MKTKHLFVLSFLTALSVHAEPVRDPVSHKLLLDTFNRTAAPQTLTNPAIDYNAFAKLTQELQPIREKHRVSEEEFLKMASESGTVILDARTTDKFQRIHVKGALHLPFTDFTDEALRKVIPDKTTRILIYCNNNFVNEPLNFASKRIEVALNIQTFINLHAYGYTNVYELGPLLDVKGTKIPFEGTSVVKR